MIRKSVTYINDCGCGKVNEMLNEMRNALQRAKENE